MMNKKGIFFTSIVLAIATLLLLSYTAYTLVDSRASTQKRVETMNNFLTSLEEDVPRQLYISGFRIFFLMQKHIVEEGEYITDAQSLFDEAFFNGTLYGVADNDTTLLMSDATFSDIVSKIQTNANKINVNLSMTNPTITIQQLDPWSITIQLDTDFFMNDKSNLASWNRTWSISAEVPIEGFQDPLYIVETAGTVSQITQSPFTFPTSSANLVTHASQTYYTNNTDAPNYLQRLEGDLSATSQYGIESLTVPKLASISGRSIVDHEYFSGTSGSQISGMPTYFIIDPSHTSLYTPV